MKMSEVVTLLASTGLPYAYHQFPEGTGIQPPFICFYYGGADDVLADNTNYVRARSLTIELYEDQDRPLAYFDTLADALSGAGLVYSHEVTDIDSEKMHLTTFYMEGLFSYE